MPGRPPARLDTSPHYEIPNAWRNSSLLDSSSCAVVDAYALRGFASPGRLLEDGLSRPLDREVEAQPPPARERKGP
jgi:hypothetical protein